MATRGRSLSSTTTARAELRALPVRYASCDKKPSSVKLRFIVRLADAATASIICPRPRVPSPQRTAPSQRGVRLPRGRGCRRLRALRRSPHARPPHVANPRSPAECCVQSCVQCGLSSPKLSGPVKGAFSQQTCCLKSPEPNSFARRVFRPSPASPRERPPAAPIRAADFTARRQAHAKSLRRPRRGGAPRTARRPL